VKNYIINALIVIKYNVKNYEIKDKWCAVFYSVNR